jgi:MazG family protein
MNSINKLLEVMAQLRDPEKGCPWDLAQDFRSIAPYTIEEAYEVAQAIDDGDLDELRQELGDLLLQVVFHARMAEEAGAFDFEQVAAGIVEKMLRRHPHVFGEDQLDTTAAQSAAWEVHKEQERATAGQQRVLDGVGLALPSLLRADKLCKRAARVGFDWPDAAGARAKITEELAELTAAEAAGDEAAMLDEMGDVLFAAANLARKLGINPEEALRGTTNKFARRFALVEDAVSAAGGDWSAHDLASLDALWEQAKRAESNPGS